MKKILFLFTYILFLTLATKSISSPVKDGSYKCIGDYIDFGASGVIAESYWETVVVDGDSVYVPKFGNYRYKGIKNGTAWWKMSGKETPYNFVKMVSHKETENKKFTVSIEKRGSPIQVQGQCTFKNY
jgi:hypothetical protein